MFGAKKCGTCVTVGFVWFLRIFDFNFQFSCFLSLEFNEFVILWYPSVYEKMRCFRVIFLPPTDFSFEPKSLQLSHLAFPPFWVARNYYVLFLIRKCRFLGKSPIGWIEHGLWTGQFVQKRGDFHFWALWAICQKKGLFLCHFKMSKIWSNKNDANQNWLIISAFSLLKV